MKSKFVLPLALLFVFLTSGYFIGCDQGNEISSKTGKHLQEAEGIISAYNATRPHSSWTKLQLGTVKIIPTGDNKIIVSCDIPDETNIINYFLQTKTIHGIKSVELGKSEIIFLERELLVNSIDHGQLYIFSLNDTDDSFLSDLNPDKEFVGFGLGSQMQSRGLNPRVGPECSCEPTSAGDDDCESGGHGSSSCSVAIASGSCNVTCQTGYFACCDHEGD